MIIVLVYILVLWYQENTHVYVVEQDSSLNGYYQIWLNRSVYRLYILHDDLIKMYQIIRKNMYVMYVFRNFDSSASHILHYNKHCVVVKVLMYVYNT